MRLGFFLGFLIGAAVASILGKTERGDSRAAGVMPPAVEPAVSEAKEAIEQTVSHARGTVEQIKQHTRDAVTAAREAADQKEAELLRQFEESTKPRI